MSVVGLHHVQLCCPAGSEDELRAFYGGVVSAAGARSVTGGVVGLAETAKPPVLAARGGVWFRAGGQELV